jgi:Spy/CpxP family protein refolding chaperone
MLRTIGRLAFSMTLLAALAAPALAQRPGGGRQGPGMRGMGGMGGLGVLMSPAGQEELKLTDEQQEKIGDVMQNMRASMQEVFQDLQDVPQEERMEKAQAKMRELAQGVEKEVKEILKEDQFKRYQEISLQAMGVNAFSQPEVAKKLELTDEQKTKVADIEQGVQDKMREMRENAGQGGNFQEVFAKMQEVREKALSDAKAVLTDEQKKTWSEMTGKEFKFQPFGGPGGGGQRRRPID